MCMHITYIYLLHSAVLVKQLSITVMCPFCLATFIDCLINNQPINTICFSSSEPSSSWPDGGSLEPKHLALIGYLFISISKSSHIKGMHYCNACLYKIQYPVVVTASFVCVCVHVHALVREGQGMRWWWGKRIHVTEMWSLAETCWWGEIIKHTNILEVNRRTWTDHLGWCHNASDLYSGGAQFEYPVWNVGGFLQSHQAVAGIVSEVGPWLLPSASSPVNFPSFDAIQSELLCMP